MSYIGKTASSATQNIFKFVPSSSATTVTGADAFGRVLSMPSNQDAVSVFLNGILLLGRGVDYSLSTSTVTFTSAYAISDEIIIITLEPFAVADMVKASTGGTFEGGTTHNGGITTTTGTFTGDVTLTGNNYNVTWDKSDNRLEFADNAKVSFGAGNDLVIEHNGTNTLMTNSTGALILNGDDIAMNNGAGTESMLSALSNSSVRLYFDGAKKLETTANGIGVENGATYSHNTNFKGIDVGDQAFYGEYDGGSLYIVKNRYYDGSNWIAKENGAGCAINIDTNGDFFIQTSGNVNAGQTGNLTTRNHFNDSGGYYWFSDGHGNGSITMYNNNTYISASSSGGEVYATDASGNHSLLSPHNFKYIPEGKSADNAWSYLSEKVTPTDKKDINGNDAKDAERKDNDSFTYVNVDMMKVVREVEKLTGTKLIYTGTNGEDDGSTVTENIIDGLTKKIETLEAKVKALEEA